MQTTPHQFHIPVMGTGFTVDTPLHIARYGISSVISLVDDTLIEQMRKVHTEAAGRPYAPITRADSDARAKRITAYLNLLDELIHEQVEVLKTSPFEPSSEITRYFDLLPEGSLKQAYNTMLTTPAGEEKSRLADALRKQISTGAIDVNIMTKLDHCSAGKATTEQGLPNSDALSALRGFANSTVTGSMVFSAGLNKALYSYVSEFEDFYAQLGQPAKKGIIIKVGDLRSAEVQGRFFAKRGIWVKEYRIESGINCGGHAFAGDGRLLGPILDDFHAHRADLLEKTWTAYSKGFKKHRGESAGETPLPMAITVQGGIGTAEEQNLLIERFGVGATGWGTPFMLVPEVVNMDEPHLAKLEAATEEEVFLSKASPLGLPFWNLNTSASEEARRERIAANQPGSPCTKRHLALDNEFGEPSICRASRRYVEQKLTQLAETEDEPQKRELITDDILARSCICNDLAGCATQRYKVDPKATPAICCGPNIVNFNRRATLEEMVDHIYGRFSLMGHPDRPHMFIREAQIYLDYLYSEIKRIANKLTPQTTRDAVSFQANIIAGLNYYKKLASELAGAQQAAFVQEVEKLHARAIRILDNLPIGETSPA